MNAAWECKTGCHAHPHTDYQFSDVPCALVSHCLQDLSVGIHSFRVRAVDNAGNVDPDPPGCAWRVLSPSGDDPASGNTVFSSARQDISSETQPADDSEDGGVVDRTRSNWLISLLLIVFVLIGLFFSCLAGYKCCTRFRLRALDRNGDGGGSQLTSLESEVLSGGIDISDFSSMAASLPEDLRRFR